MPEGFNFPLTFTDLLYWVNFYTGRTVKSRAFRAWFTWCEVSRPDGLYEWSDMAKLVVFGRHLNTFRSYEIAQLKLIEEVENDYYFFFPDEAHTIDVKAKAA